MQRIIFPHLLKVELRKIWIMESNSFYSMTLWQRKTINKTISMIRSSNFVITEILFAFRNDVMNTFSAILDEFQWCPLGVLELCCFFCMLWVEAKW